MRRNIHAIFHWISSKLRYGFYEDFFGEGKVFLVYHCFNKPYPSFRTVFVTPNIRRRIKYGV